MSRIVCLPFGVPGDLPDMSHAECRNVAHRVVADLQQGFAVHVSGRRLELAEHVERSKRQKLSLPPGSPLPDGADRRQAITEVQVANVDTVVATRRLTDAGYRPLALNFANGFTPGGGFLGGSRAQEECICRMSGLWATLVGDPMYDHHAEVRNSFTSDWAIVSPDVPIFRDPQGFTLDAVWTADFVSCAAPDLRRRGRHPGARPAMQKRIHRVLAIGESLGYDAMVLGAWGCGAFGNDPAETAYDFRAALEGPFAGAFRRVVFAIADRTPSLDNFAPFAATFAPR